MQRFTELQIWKRSHQLALDVYRLTATFPKSEQFGGGNLSNGARAPTVG